MGILSRLGGRETGNSNPDLAGHQIDRFAVLAPTDPKVPTPRNPGQFTSIRSAPVLEDPRYFNGEEVKVLKAVVKTKKQQLKSTSASYESLRQIDDVDVSVHGTYYGYRTHLANNEVKKLGANAKYAEALHGMRPRYVDLGTKLDQADQKSQLKIQAMKAKLQSNLNRPAPRS
ncbi:MAG: hypothetical protein HC825_02475 [Oscillatoriales cyanobacterium RM1_1_9]|nr:hypothetical protein [Oscillatoriales cyanobacterium SM2_3_0]NJO45955.1 hypothetical protein [Oscillatoriales cyanobacterium RM2_1_1]NJO70861.1 hypothetical protein [Oscillatoriales cyanobacterium RM1_1_9]